jgi:hypothetical protein
MRNVSGKVVEKTKTNILCSITFFRKSCRLSDNVEKYCRARQATDDSIIRRMRFACWITKATDTHSEYLIPVALPRQQWLRERAPMFLYKYIACLVLFKLRYSPVGSNNNTPNECFLMAGDMCHIFMSVTFKSHTDHPCSYLLEGKRSGSNNSKPLRARSRATNGEV